MKYAADVKKYAAWGEKCYADYKIQKADLAHDDVIIKDDRALIASINHATGVAEKEGLVETSQASGWSTTSVILTGVAGVTIGAAGALYAKSQFKQVDQDGFQQI